VPAARAPTGVLAGRAGRSGAAGIAVAVPHL